MMPEVWKPVVGYEGLYEISSAGNVKSLAREVRRGDSTRLLTAKLLATYCQDGVNYRVSLSKQGKCRVYYLSKLMREAFGEDYEAPKKSTIRVKHVKTDKKDGMKNGMKNLLSAWG